MKWNNVDGQFYTLDVIRAAVERYRAQVASGRALGPITDGVCYLNKASFLVDSIELEGDRATLEITTLDTGPGQQLSCLLQRNDCFVRFLPCGMGSIRDGVVQDDYVLAGFRVEGQEPSEQSEIS